MKALSSRQRGLSGVLPPECEICPIHRSVGLRSRAINPEARKSSLVMRAVHWIPRPAIRAAHVKMTFDQNDLSMSRTGQLRRREAGYGRSGARVRISELHYRGVLQ